MDSEQINQWITGLNHPEYVQRISALRVLKGAIDRGDIPKPERLKDVNSHIHTIYSFSPYSPSSAVFQSWKAGLVTTGIMDHDSISGAEEFIEAGRIMEMPTTVGAEIRASFAQTRLNGRKINNPDQETVAYVALHGIPHPVIPELKRFFRPISAARGKRNRQMVDRLNRVFSGSGISIDYDLDVLPLSMAHEGGSVTERHLLFAATRKIISSFGKGQAMIRFLEDRLGLNVSGKNLEYLQDPQNGMVEYDLLNLLKGNLVEKFYLPAKEEAYPIRHISRFADQHGIILAYAYLGDVTESVTGDKKAQKFEDDYLDEVFETLVEEGLKSVTYMPSRNTPKQLERLRELCDRTGLFQISGEDINQPRQSFVCEAMRKPEFSNLYDAAWALIGHEWLSSEDLRLGMFSEETQKKMPTLEQRIAYYKKYALETFG
jgi:hypothetical protein